MNQLQAFKQLFMSYTPWTATTAVYYEKNRIPYLLLGLWEELQEWRCEVITELPNLDRVKKELGDVSWYLGQLHLHTGWVDIAWDVPDGEHFAVNLIRYTKRFLRGDELEGNPLEGFDYGRLIIHSAKLFEIPEGLWVDFYADVLNTNRRKLEDRKSRDVLTGSGDER